MAQPRLLTTREHPEHTRHLCEDPPGRGEKGNGGKGVMSRQLCKSWERFSSSSIYLAAASGKGIVVNLPVTFASDSALK